MARLHQSPSEFLEAARACPPRCTGVPRGVFLVEPADFRLANESASDNRYMRMDLPVDPLRALLQHQDLARALADAGVPTVSFPGCAATPDAIFPNNVFATAPGRLIVGAMRHRVRQLEAERADIRAWFRAVLGYACVDLSGADCVAELTGSLVIDRARRVGFCGISERCDPRGAELMAAAFGLEQVLVFALAPGEYHTNVVMSALGGRGVLLCREGFADPAAADAIAALYPGASVVIDIDEKAAYAGNCIALGERGLWMSACASRGLRAATRAGIEALGLQIHAVDLDEIERAGGSLRCMIGEIY